MIREQALRSAMLHTMRASLATHPDGAHHADGTQQQAKKRREAEAAERATSYVPLARRPTAESVEVRTKGRAR